MAFKGTQQAQPVTPAGAGEYQIYKDSVDGVLKVIHSTASVVSLEGATDTDAIHDNVASEISAIVVKTVPAPGDFFVLEDSAAANVKKHTLFSQIESTLNHDSLAGFLTAEHVDWAGASAGTIHITNFAALQNVVEDTTPQFVATLDMQGNTIDMTSGTLTFDGGGALATLNTAGDSFVEILNDGAGEGEVRADKLGIKGGTGFALQLDGTPTANRLITIQDVAQTLVGRATTDTLTNKTLTLPILTLNSALVTNGQWGINATDDQFKFRSGGANHVVIKKLTPSQSWKDPVSGDRAILHHVTEEGVTGLTVKTAIRAGTSVAWQIRRDTDQSAAGTLMVGATTSSTTAITTTVFTGAVAVGQTIWIEADTVTGSVANFFIQLELKMTET